MKKVLAITQCFPCGSWGCIEKILINLQNKNYEVKVLGLGNIQSRIKDFSYLTIPYPAFNKYGDITCGSPILNLIWNVPLILTGLSLFLILRPSVVTYNGLVTGLLLSPFAKIMGIKSVVMYHSYLGQLNNKTLMFILKFLGKFPDAVVVNSRGSAEDIKWFIPGEKMIMNEHFADDIFFDKPGKMKPKNVSLHVVYAGRIDEDKRCFPLIEAAEIIAKNPENNIKFSFAGAGTQVKKILDIAKDEPKISYIGYISEREKLKEFYDSADVVWSFADKTYLGLPAVEALACGKPIIIPKRAAIAGSNETIDASLVPENVGWLLDTDNIEGVVRFIKELSVTKEYSLMSDSCINLARKKYSKQNVEMVANKIDALVSKNG